MTSMTTVDFADYGQVIQDSAGDTTIVSVSSQKGGVGKSTATMLAAEAFVTLGLRVLMVDFDPLGTLSDVMLTRYGFGFPADELWTVKDWLGITDEPSQAAYLDAKRVASQLRPGLYLLPTDNGLEDVLNELSADPGKLYALRDAIRARAGWFDVVVIDAPPSVSALAWAALVAADVVVVPTLPDMTAIKGLRNVIRQIDDVRVNLGEAPTLVGVLANMVNTRIASDREAMEELQTGDMPRLLGTLPRRRGRRAWAELTAAFAPIAFNICKAAGIAVPRTDAPAE